MKPVVDHPLQGGGDPVNTVTSSVASRLTLSETPETETSSSSMPSSSSSSRSPPRTPPSSAHVHNPFSSLQSPSSALLPPSFSMKSDYGTRLHEFEEHLNQHVFTTHTLKWIEIQRQVNNTQHIATPHTTTTTPISNSMTAHKLDRKLVTEFLFTYGCPERSRIRSLMWKLLLGYLPWNVSDWNDELKKKREAYNTFKKELITNPFASMNDDQPSEQQQQQQQQQSSSITNQSGVKVIKMSKISVGDDPLGALGFGGSSTKSSTDKQTTTSSSSSDSTKGSVWAEYYKDQVIREQIEKDVRRTYSNFHFFQERVQPKVMTEEELRKKKEAERLKRQQEESLKKQGLFQDDVNLNAKIANNSSSHVVAPSRDKSEEELEDEMLKSPFKKAEDETHHDVIKRILFVYAKLNPGVLYVQGMNELLAPLYYVFSNDSDPLFKGFAEADAFFCFNQVMSEVRDRFIKTLDLAPTGVISIVKEVNQLLQRVDFQLWEHLDTLGVDPRFYSFRWLTLMLSQEFELPEVLRLWDSLFADHDRFKFLNDCCCAMLVSIRKQLLNGDFSDCLKLLQAFPGQDVQRIIHVARGIQKQRRANGGRVEFKSAPPPVANPQPKQILRANLFKDESEAPLSASSAGVASASRPVAVSSTSHASPTPTLDSAGYAAHSSQTATYALVTLPLQAASLGVTYASELLSQSIHALQNTTNKISGVENDETPISQQESDQEQDKKIENLGGVVVLDDEESEVNENNDGTTKEAEAPAHESMS